MDSSEHSSRQDELQELLKIQQKHKKIGRIVGETGKTVGLFLGGFSASEAIQKSLQHAEVGLMVSGLFLATWAAAAEFSRQTEDEVMLTEAKLELLPETASIDPSAI